MDNWTIRWLDGGRDDLTDAFGIRLEVFCREQGYAPEMELDEIDRLACHVLICQEEVPVATGRLYRKADGVCGLGRIAVRRQWRGRGLGALVVEKLTEKARVWGAIQTELDAQEQAVGFYQKQGYVLCGERHMDGHVPHRMMRCNLF